MSFYEKYLVECNTESDIYLHLPKLYELALECESITEFGVGYGRSTTAFLAACEQSKGWLDSYDVCCLDGVLDKFVHARKLGINATFHLEDTFVAQFHTTDMLLVDSRHTNYQVTGELLLHGDKVQKYIAFHDVVTFGFNDEFGDGPGIVSAIELWRSTRPEWITVHESKENNGMLIMERRYL